jgi:ATP-dependent RNA helicase RhlE
MTISMNDLNLIPALVDAVADMGYTEATPIQAQAIPVVLAGRDLIACAATGTGKTAAFMLPLLQLVHAGKAGRCRALILSPTRELALQIDEQAQALSYHLDGLSAAPVVGGMEMGPQERWLRAGAAIVVATPGRLLDHMRFSYVDLSAVEILVLDEADRMLDMGFLPDIQRILDALPKTRQTLLFSATMSPTIRKLAAEILKDPATVTVDRQAPHAAIEQSVCAVAQERKAALLSALLRRDGMDSVLVFVRRKVDADRLARAVTHGGVRATSIHSDRSQKDRIAALEGFRSGEFPVLIATDVAARGLDVSGISHVINFDVPHSSDDYIHRAGRTARAGAAGDVITFVSPAEEERLHDIETELGITLPRITVRGFAAPAAAAPARTTARSPSGQAPRRGRRRRRAAAV